MIWLLGVFVVCEFFSIWVLRDRVRFIERDLNELRHGQRRHRTMLDRLADRSGGGSLLTIDEAMEDLEVVLGPKATARASADRRRREGP